LTCHRGGGASGGGEYVCSVSTTEFGKLFQMFTTCAEIFLCHSEKYNLVLTGLNVE